LHPVCQASKLCYNATREGTLPIHAAPHRSPAIRASGERCPASARHTIIGS
jgi:hypothetical protein